MNIAETVIIRSLSQQAYLPCWRSMQTFTHHRDAETTDEIWLLEHSPVYTQGQNGNPLHLIKPTSIPVIKTDRGGQITYHGPGQLMVYTLVDMKRKQLNVREFVCLLEKTIIQFLAASGIQGETKTKAPGIYVNEQKIASVGLRIRRGCTYHGLAFNINMDMQPFSSIHPCGFEHLQMTQLTALTQIQTLHEISQQLMAYLLPNLGYTKPEYCLENDSFIYTQTT